MSSPAPLVPYRLQVYIKVSQLATPGPAAQWEGPGGCHGNDNDGGRAGETGDKRSMQHVGPERKQAAPVDLSLPLTVDVAVTWTSLPDV